MANEFYGRPGSGTTYSSDAAYGVLAKIYSANYVNALYDRPRAFMKLRNFTAEVKSAGSSVMIPVFPRLTAQAVSLTDGSITSENTAIEQAELVINKSYGVDYRVPMNVLAQTQLPDLAGALAANSAAAIVDQIDKTIVTDIIPDITTVATSNHVGTLGTDMDETQVLDALGVLVKNHVNMENTSDFVWILPASQFGVIHKLKGYTNYRILPGNGTEGGQDVQAKVLTLAGIDVHFRNDTAMSVTGGKLGGLFYRDSVAVAIQREPTLLPVTRVPSTILMDFFSWCLYGVKLMKPTVACQIRTK